jgi:hypothetical protein
MRLAFRIISTLLIVAGVGLFAWPAPLFTLNEPWVSLYLTYVLCVGTEPGGAAEGLPFLWLVTAPAGLAASGVGILLHSYATRGDK